MKSIYIYGSSGHGLVVADIAQKYGYNKIIFIDDGNNEHLSFKDIYDKNITFALGVGSNQIRKKLFNKIIKYKFKIISLIDPTATLSKDVLVGIGTVIMPHVVINSGTKIGKGVILNSSSIIEHENIIEDFVHISPNVSLAGKVTISENTHIGIGSNVIENLTIGSNCIVGAGSTVVKNLKSNKLAYGNPCREIKDI